MPSVQVISPHPPLYPFKVLGSVREMVWNTLPKTTLLGSPFEPIMDPIPVLILVKPRLLNT